MKVVDASVALKWVLDEEDGVAAARTLLRDPAQLTAPSFWLVEAGSALWRRCRMSLLSADEAATKLAFLAETPLRTVDVGELAPAALRLSLDLDHPIYDCTYLALALRENLPLVTADRRFATVLTRHGHGDLIELIGLDQP